MPGTVIRDTTIWYALCTAPRRGSFTCHANATPDRSTPRGVSSPSTVSAVGGPGGAPALGLVPLDPLEHAVNPNASTAATTTERRRRIDPVDGTLHRNASGRFFTGIVRKVEAGLLLAGFQSYLYAVGNNATAAVWICAFLLAAATAGPAWNLRRALTPVLLAAAVCGLLVPVGDAQPGAPRHDGAARPGPGREQHQRATDAAGRALK